MLLRERIQKRDHPADHRVVEFRHLFRQGLVELGQRVARTQHAHHLDEVAIAERDAV